jgi:hypothetical protein
LGAHWAPFTIPTPAGTQPRILAIDPDDSDIVYLRLITGTTDSVAIAAGGGTSFTIPLTITGAFTSFLRAGDGTLYAGTMLGALYVRPPAASTFEQRTAPHLRCLGQRPGTSRIYACADMNLDGFSIGYSDDGANTFQKVMKFTELKGPLTCSEVQTACAAHWARIQLVLGISDAGTGGPDAGPSPSGKSGSCDTTPDAPSLLTAALAVLLALVLRGRAARSP